MPSHVARLLCLTFLVALYAPLVAAVLEPQASVLQQERRARHPLPIFSEVDGWARYTALLEATFADHVGFRDGLLTAHGWLHYVLLGDAPSSRVRVGDDGWLFLSGPDDEITAYRDTTPAAAPLRARSWRDLLVRVDRWSRAHGKTFIFVMAPNKETIYPQHLPWHAPRARPPTIADALFALLERDGVAAVDLRPALKAAASSRRVYLKTDTHWNGQGAVVAARQVLAAVGRATGRPAPRLQVELTNRWGSGDLAMAMHLSDALGEAVVEARPTRAAMALPVAAGAVAELAAFRGRAGLPAAFIYHDSFGERLQPLLAAQLSRSVWRRSKTIDGEEILASGAEVVVLEAAERFLAGPPTRARRVDVPDRADPARPAE